jgi:SET domain-containing protein
MHHSDLIRVKRVKGKGRGVFARKQIQAGSVIEKVPVIIIPNNTFVDGEPNPYRMKYFFVWSKSTVAMVLGYGSIYNHSYAPNARYEHGPMVLTFRALRDIEKDEEITINYNYTPGDKASVGFEVV